MYPKGHLTEGAFPDQLNEFVVLECCRWELIVLLDVRLNELDELISFLKDGFIHLCRSIYVGARPGPCVAHVRGA